MQNVVNCRENWKLHIERMPKNIKASVEIPAKGVQIHWLPQEKIVGSVRCRVGVVA
jgi:hypothetical protein